MDASTMLAHVYRDIQLIRSGTWSPEDADLSAMQDMLSDVHTVLIGKGLTPRGSPGLRHRAKMIY
jgi:hypothetical protein